MSNRLSNQRKEKILLYSALSVTAAAAVYGIVKTRGSHTSTDTTDMPIVSVPLDEAPSRHVTRAEIPVRLTASDGTGLKLAELRAEAVVQDPLALTELHLVFENPEDRVLEGTFRMVLPQGASLSRFAMRVGNVWQEGEVVEKRAARLAYEDFLHRKQDPALMEQGAGNEFSARVFPIPARGRKEIIVTYASSLEIGAPYVLPLRGLSALGTLDVDVHASGSWKAKGGPSSGKNDASFSLHQTNFTPSDDFVVEGKNLPRSAGLRSEDIVLARVIPFTSSRPDPITSMLVMVDTSASRGMGLAEQLRLLKDLVAKLPARANVEVVAFDQEVVPIWRGAAADFGEKAVADLDARSALGASNFEKAIDWAKARGFEAKIKRVVILGDGVATAGETDAQKLKEHVEKLREAGIERMDAIAVGGLRDDAFLRTVVRGVLDHDGAVLDGDLGASAIARRLAEATTSGIPVEVEGADWSWPKKLDGLQAGDEVLVYAKLPASKNVKITVGTQQFSPDLRTAPRPLVERAWAQAKIQSLVDAPEADAATTKQQIISLSTAHRIVSPYTSMLVLETDADYRRFGIDRTAKLDILAVQNGEIAVTESPRSWSADDLVERRRKTGAPPRPTPPRDEAPATAQAAAPAPTTMAESAPQEPADKDEDRAAARDEGAMPSSGMANAAPPPAPPPPPPADVAAEFAAPATPSAPGGAASHDSLGGLGAVGTGSGGGGSAGARGHATVDEPRQGIAASPRRTAPRPVAPSHADAAERLDARSSSPSRGVDLSGVVSNGSTAGRLQVRPGTFTVQRLERDEVQRALRGATLGLRTCYERAVRDDERAHGTLEVRVTIDPQGTVSNVVPVRTLPNDALQSCSLRVLRSMTFASKTGGEFSTSFDFVNLSPLRDDANADLGRRNPNVAAAFPYEGRFRNVMEKLARGDKDDGLAEAKVWQREQPGDVLALVALGEASEARGDVKTAARAYGSILELFSSRADSRRFAGERLERLADDAALDLAVDTYQKAVEQRPDHPASHRLLAYALLKAGKPKAAFEAIQKGARPGAYPSDRFPGVDRILKEDVGLIAAAWSKTAPERRAEIAQKSKAAGGIEPKGPSLRFVLNWETDANDVDFHIYDSRGGHAYYGQRNLASGGELYADITTGYGPECFTVAKSSSQRAYPYTLQAHYYSRGPMGYGMGKLEILDYDGAGGITFEERPFVVMTDRAFVDLGVVGKGPTKVAAEH